MLCAGCGQENDDAGRFCSNCGVVLAPGVCLRCGEALSPEARFCTHCGQAVARRGGPGEVGQERRQLSVMFADLVDSTPLANALDAEEFSELLSAYQQLCTEFIERFGGRVAQFLGDGVLAYFGHPLAHEDDAVRAVSAAVGIRDEMPQQNERLVGAFPILHERPLRVRLAVHTGMVVVGDAQRGDRADGLAVGDTVHLALSLLRLPNPFDQGL